MNKLRSLMLAGLTAAAFSNSPLEAQDQDQTQPPRQRPGGGPGGGGGGGRGNFDPEQMRQRMMDRLREQFEVKSDDEWKIISERLTKVMDARRDASAGAAGMFGRPGGRRGGDGNAGDAGGPGARFRGLAGEPLPEADALEKALEAKASPEELKAKVAKLREARKEKEAKLEKAQDELRKVLSVRQEATAVLNGYLK